MIEGLCRMDEQEKDYIVSLSKRASADDLILFYCFTLQKPDNPLLMNLFWEISLFFGFPFAKPGLPFRYDKKVGREQFTALVSLIKAGTWDSVKKTLIKYQRYYIGEVIKCMEPQIRNVPKENQISFAWRIYRDRPQICYNLASLLLHEIYMGEYRTTTIGERCNKPDYTNPVIRRNLSYFIQSYELFSYTYEDVSRHFIHFPDAEEREEIISRFEENQRAGLCAISILHYLQRHHIQPVSLGMSVKSFA